MFEDADNFADIFRGGLPYYLLLTLPILIICSSNPVLASSEFTVHRMSQFDLNGVAYGCRASVFSLEAKSLYTWSTSRHCVVSKFQDLTIDRFHEIRQKAGGLVILLPKDIASLSFEEKEHLYMLEQAMLAQVSSIPVYFSTYNSDLEQVIEDISKSSDVAEKGSRRGSAVTELLNSISANGYQVVVSGVTHVPNKQSKIPIIQGELAPIKNSKVTDMDLNSKLPIIMITSHLNTFGLYNEYPLNADAAVLLTIADLFSKLQNTENTAPKYRLMFLISESNSLLNFQGSKKWLDDNVQLQNVDFVICLDTISQPILTESDSMYMHVSKPPKEGSSMHTFLRHLKSVGQKYENMTVEGVHKKINLAEVQLAWEHERFSMKRLPAFTVSSLKSHKEPIRTTIFKDNEEEILKNTQRNAKILIETLARYIYNINDGEIFAGTTNINKNMIKSLSTIKSALQNNDLKNGFEKYLKNVKIVYEKPDARDPEFMLYEGHDANFNVYRVKPAVFDLFLTFLIATYLFLVYLVIQYFPNLYSIICKMTKNNVPKVKNN